MSGDLRVYAKQMPNAKILTGFFRMEITILKHHVRTLCPSRRAPASIITRRGWPVIRERPGRPSRGQARVR